MEDLVAQLKDKVGLTDEQAIQAIHVMKDYITGKVPPMFSGFVDTFFANNNAATEEDPLA